MEITHGRRLPLSVQLVGVDGGATKVEACEALVVEGERGACLRPGRARARREYGRVPGFAPLAEGRGDGPIGGAEREQGWRMIEATARAIVAVAREREAKSLLVGVAMPGEKTPDRRGIARALHAPRVPDFLDRLEEILLGDGVELALPIARLESDGDCCGLGEELGEQGSFRGVAHAYFVGGGTGLAEALKLAGELVPFEGAEGFLPRAWRLLDSDGAPYEDSLSADGINRAFARAAQRPLPLARGEFPEDCAASDERAQVVLARAAERLAELVAARLTALALRSPEEIDFPGPFLLGRVVLGQRLGKLFADPRTRPWLEGNFWDALRQALAFAPAELGPALEHLQPPQDLSRTAFHRRLIRVSSQESGAALGAAGAALLAWEQGVG
jgi:predicted NBD/HSP70 family sugar kinase